MHLRRNYSRCYTWAKDRSGDYDLSRITKPANVQAHNKPSTLEAATSTDTVKAGREQPSLREVRVLPRSFTSGLCSDGIAGLNNVTRRFNRVLSSCTSSRCRITTACKLACVPGRLPE